MSGLRGGRSRRGLCEIDMGEGGRKSGGEVREDAEK